MLVGNYLHPPPPGRKRRNGRRGNRGGRSRRSLPLAKFVAAYALALTISIIEKILLFNLGLEPASILIMILLMYLTTGYALNRYILTQLWWNPNFANLSTVSSAKLLTLLLWPISYLILIWQLWVVRYL